MWKLPAGARGKWAAEWLALALVVGCALPVFADDDPALSLAPEFHEFYGEAEVEGNLFLRSPRFAGQRRDHVSFAIEPTLFAEWADGDLTATFTPFARVDSADTNRSHVDIREAKIDRAGCFKYENVAHADSRDLPGHLPEEVKEERWHRFMETQAEISTARAKAQIGSVQDVIIDGPDEAAGTYLARSKADAPEIDGVVYLKSNSELKPGDIISAKIEDADAYDLFAQTL